MIEKVAEIQVEHVVRALQDGFNWTPGCGRQRPGTQKIRNWMKEHFDNGTSPNRMVSLVPEAVAVMSGATMPVPLTVSDHEEAVSLPPKMLDVLQCCSNDIGAAMTRCHVSLAELVAQDHRDCDDDVRKRVMAAQAEMAGSLTSLRDNNQALEADVVEALDSLDAAEAKISQFQEELDLAGTRINEIQEELNAVSVNASDLKAAYDRLQIDNQENSLLAERAKTELREAELAHAGTLHELNSQIIELKVEAGRVRDLESRLAEAKDALTAATNELAAEKMYAATAIERAKGLELALESEKSRADGAIATTVAMKAALDAMKPQHGKGASGKTDRNSQSQKKSPSKNSKGVPHVKNA